MEKKQTHLVYGMVTAVIMVIINLVIYLAGWAFIDGVPYVTEIPLLVGLILNAMAYSKANDGYVTFGNVFSSCFKATMIVTVIMVVWCIVTIYAMPEMKEKVLEVTRQKMLKNPQVTDDIMEMSMNFTRKYWNAIAIASAIIGTLFFGTIFSLIAGGIAKKNGEMPFPEDNV